MLTTMVGRMLLKSNAGLQGAIKPTLPPCNSCCCQAKSNPCSRRQSSAQIGIKGNQATWCASGRLRAQRIVCLLSRTTNCSLSVDCP